MEAQVVFIDVPGENVKIHAEACYCGEGKENGRYGIIIAHPHPKFGGNMENNVVSALFDALQDHPACHSVLRLNFRGVQRSTGSGSWRGWAERADIKAANDFLMNQFPSSCNIPPPQHTIIIGYSFGSVVACGVSSEIESCAGTVAISIPLGWLSWCLFSSHYKHIVDNKLPKLLVIGSKDNFSTTRAFNNFVDSLQGENKSSAVAGKDHFWFNNEDLVVTPVLE